MNNIPNLIHFLIIFKKISHSESLVKLRFIHNFAKNFFANKKPWNIIIKNISFAWKWDLLASEIKEDKIPFNEQNKKYILAYAWKIAKIVVS